MRVVQPKTEKFNDKNESAFKYAVFIRKVSQVIRLFSLLTRERLFHKIGLVKPSFIETEQGLKD